MRTAVLAAMVAVLAPVDAAVAQNSGGDQFSRTQAARRAGLPSESTVSNAAADLRRLGRAAQADELRALSRLAELLTVAQGQRGLTPAEEAERARLAQALNTAARPEAVARIEALLAERRRLTASAP